MHALLGMDHPVSNLDIAGALERLANLLDARGVDHFRVHAYRAAAERIKKHPRAMTDIFAIEGTSGLEELPGIGAGIARCIQELAGTGHLGRLERLEGGAPAEALLMTVPGVGPRMARRIHEGLGIESLEDLELAAHDGRLRALGGFGPRRIRAIRDVLATRLGRFSRPARGAKGRDEGEAPNVATLLEVDEEYRCDADAGALPTIAPRRFNPKHESWLPILHTERDGFHFTALFSNTARAHDLHTIHDWVVLVFERNGDSGRATVVTETHGPLAGLRVVRGREDECARHYATASGTKLAG